MEVAPDERRGHPYRYGHHQGDSVIPDKAGLRACCNKRNGAGLSGPVFYVCSRQPYLLFYPPIRLFSLLPKSVFRLQPVVKGPGQVSREIQSIALPDAAGPCLVCLRFLFRFGQIVHCPKRLTTDSPLRSQWIFRHFLSVCRP